MFSEGAAYDRPGSWAVTRRTNMHGPGVTLGRKTPETENRKLLRLVLVYLLMIEKDDAQLNFMS